MILGSTTRLIKELEKYDTWFEELVDQKRLAIKTVTEKMLQDIIPRLKNWHVEISEGWCGAEIILTRKNKSALNCIHYNNSIYSNAETVERFPILQELDVIVNTLNEHSILGRSDISIHTVVMKGEYFPK